MQKPNAKALTVLMALLILPEPSLAARKPLRPSNYPESTDLARLNHGQPNRKAKRGALKQLLAKKPSKKKKKGDKGKAPAAIAKHSAQDPAKKRAAEKAPPPPAYAAAPAAPAQSSPSRG